MPVMDAWTRGSLVVAMVATAATWAAAQPPDAGGEWPSYGGTNWSQKYSPLDQISGAAMSDRAILKEWPPGSVQGFDVRTGDLKWVFQTIPQAGEFGEHTWDNSSNLYTGNANVWSTLSGDAERRRRAGARVSRDDGADQRLLGVLGRVALPARPLGTPMTYMVDGRQFIVLTLQGAQMVALALPAG